MDNLLTTNSYRQLVRQFSFPLPIVNLTKIQDPAIMNKATDLSGLLDSKKQVISSLKSLQSIIKRLNNSNNLNIDIDMMNSR